MGNLPCFQVKLPGLISSYPDKLFFYQKFKPYFTNLPKKTLHLIHKCVIYLISTITTHCLLYLEND